MEQAQSKLYVSLKPPLPNIRIIHSPKSPTIPLSPTQHHIIRRTSNNKSIKKSSAQKTKNQKAFQLEIKYSKEQKQQIKTDQSIFTQSEDTFGRSFNKYAEDSQQTVQRITSFSRQKTDRIRKNQKSIEKGNAKVLDSLSGYNQSISKKSIGDKNEEYYLYWKNKAHQYLQSNIKFMEKITTLTRQNQQLKQTVLKLKVKQIDENSIKQQKIQFDENLSNLRSISLHYLNKIQQLEKQLKRKEVIIHTYQAKIKEHNQSLAGERQRTKLLTTMKTQIGQLKNQNCMLTKQLQQFNTNSKHQAKVIDAKGVSNKLINIHK